jgi:hypothetical protein
MKISNLTECTTAGAVATVAQPFETVQKRTPEKKLKGSNLLKGIKTSAKYANSLHEAAEVGEQSFAVGQKVEVHHGGAWVPATITAVDRPGKYKIRLSLNGKMVDYVSGAMNTRAVAEGTIGKAVKSVKRGMQGWGSIPIREPQEIVTRNKGYDEQIKMLHQTRRRGEHTAPKHSPQDLQNRVVDREMKKRGLGEQGVAEGSWHLPGSFKRYDNYNDWLSAVKAAGREISGDNWALRALPIGKERNDFGQWDKKSKTGWIKVSKTKGVAEGELGIEDMVMDQYYNGNEVSEIARNLHISDDEVQDIIDQHGVAEAAGREFKPGDSKPKQTPSKLTNDPEKIRQANALLKGSDKEHGIYGPPGSLKNVKWIKEQGVAEGSLTDKQHSYWDNVAKEKKNKEQAVLKDKKAEHEKTPIGKAEKYWAKKGVAEGYGNEGREPMVGETCSIRNYNGYVVLQGLSGDKARVKFDNGRVETVSRMDLIPQREKVNSMWEGNKIDEGRFVKGPGGVPLDRQGNSIPPKPQAEPKAPAVRRDTNGLTRADYNTVWRKIEDVVGQIFPDGDPIDWLGPWLNRQGIKDYHGGEVLNKACRLNGFKDIYAYYDHFKTGDYGYEDPKLKGFLDNGGQVQHGSFKGPRKAEKTDFGSTHIGGAGDKMKASRTGLAARSLGNKIVGLPEEKEKTAAESDISTVTDPELRHAIEKAKTHYGGIKDPITAFRKLTIRGLKHAEENDLEQNTKIREFERVIGRMKQEIFSLRQQVTKPVSEGEITEDDVVLSADRRKPKAGLLSKPEPTTNPADTVKLDIPLLIRLLEFAKEDAVDDMALHDLAEKLVASGARGRTLTMKDYDNLVPEKQPEYNDATDSVVPESLLGGAAAAGIIANDDDEDFQVSFQRKMGE